MTSQAKRLGPTERTALELCSLATEGTQEITEIDFLTEMEYLSQMTQITQIYFASEGFNQHGS